MEASSLAKRLAANEKTMRDRTLKKLKKYIAVKSAKTGFTSEELLTLWKGLHYCFWMQDKPILQEELSAKLCGLLKSFPDGHSALAFADAFFKTQANEWGRLDQWRMDKFMMLIRDFLHGTFEVLKRNGWERTLVCAVSELVGDMMDAGKEANPDGLRLHLADMYLEELLKVGDEELDCDQTNLLVEPFLQYIVHSKRDVIADRVLNAVFGTILQTLASTENEDKEDGTYKLKYNYSALQQSLFEAGKQKDVLPRVRQKLYKLVKRLSNKCGLSAEATQPATGTDQGEKKQGKRKKSDNEDEPKQKKKKKKMKAPEEKQAKTSASQKEQVTPKDTPQSTPKHVVFDMARNSSRGLQEFVKSAASPASPYLPNRSPKQGILKDSPDVDTALSFLKAGRTARGDTPKGVPKRKGRKYSKNGESSMESASLFREKKVAHKKFKKGMSPKKGTSPSFVSKKKGKMAKKPKRR